MKNRFGYIPEIIIGIALLTSLSVSCKKDEDEEDETVPSAPTAYTDTVSYISQTWTTLNGVITPGNLLTTVTFEYDTTTAYSNTIHADPDTISGKSSGKRSIEITGLIPNTTYHYRVVAQNSMGTSYGTDRTFTTFGNYTSDIVFNPDLVYDQLTDIQGNTYKTIQIGTQIWMAENLAVKQYNDGTDIPQVSNSSRWSSLETGGLCWYNNTTTLYGALYNWHSVKTGKLCPAGWHVPTDEEWSTLLTYIGGTSAAGSSLKETGTLHWLVPNSGAVNSTGFTALPGGYRYYSGTYSNIYRYGYWWSSTESTSTNAYSVDLNYSYSYSDRISIDKRSGVSVRCVKD